MKTAAIACLCLAVTLGVASVSLAQATGDPDETTPATSDAGPGYAELKVDLTPREGMTVGDRVQAEVVLVWMGPEPADEPRFPSWQETWGGAEVLETGDVESFVDQSQRRIYRQTVQLTAFEVGEVRLPPVTVAVPLADRTEELRTPGDLRFEVVSVLPEEAAEDGGEDAAGDPQAAVAEPLEPRPAAAPRRLAASPLYLGIAGALAVVIVLAVVAMLRRMTLATGTAVFARPRPAPLDELLQRLRGLDPGAGSEPVHTGLSLAVRDFLGRTLGIHALEATTSEIQRHLRSTEVPAGLAQNTVRLLRDCDQVKFARLEVDAAVAGDRVTLAQTMAREIDELLHRPPEPELATEAR